MYQLQLLCQRTPRGLRILQGFGELTVIRIPEKILGLPVAEIGPYCFSATEPDHPEAAACTLCTLQLDDAFFPVSEQPAEEILLPPLQGRYLEEVYLPSSVQILHNAAFYNCRKLHTLGLGLCLSAIGSDEFTNCTRLSRLFYEGSPNAGCSALSLILGRLEMDLFVYFVPKGANAHLQSVTCALFFPEFYEWMDEVTPAHLFSRSIHGEGFRMRKCFQNDVLRFGKYDACFENAVKTETAKSLCRIAICRLLWPKDLPASCRALYEEALATHYDTALGLAIADRNTTILGLLYDLGREHPPGRGPFGAAGSPETARERCIAADWGEGAAFWMEKTAERQGFARKTFDFEEF